MKMMWCWRCGSDMPMLDEDEFALVVEAFQNGGDVVDRERQRRGVQERDPLILNSQVAERFRPVLEMYRLLTGSDATNPNAVWHHRISEFGPPCPNCDRPLRTPAARYCAACGYGMDAIQSDPRPLVEREPAAFTRSRD